MNDKDFEFNFFIGDNDKNTSKEEFEDIFSNSHLPKGSDEVSLNSFAGGNNKKYNKKSHNFWGRLKKWWNDRKRWQKALMISCTSVFLVIAIALGVVLSVFDYNYNSITGDNEELGFENVLNEDIVNIALFGIDTRNLDSFKGNSDSIMILSLNTLTKKVKIISVMRDSFVPITYNGKTTYGKINSAYSKGGPELAIKVLNTNFGLDISEYATVNFYGMVDIIDAVGGIEAELTPAEVVPASKNLYAINACIKEMAENLGLNASKNYITKSGVQKLNGLQAVAYSRIRYVANIWGTNNDYGRTDRQRYVMEQLFNKALTLEKSQYIKLAKSLIPCSETSLSYSEIMSLAFDILLKSPSFSQARIPQQEFLMPQPSTSAGSVVYYDLAFAEKLIHAFIYDDITFEDYIANNGIEKNNWYKGATINKRPTNDSSSSSQSKPTEEGPSITEPDESKNPTEENSKPSDTGEDDTTTNPPEQDNDDGSSKPTDEEDTESSKPVNPDTDESSSEDTPSTESGDDTEQGDDVQQPEDETNQ